MFLGILAVYNNLQCTHINKNPVLPFQEDRFSSVRSTAVFSTWVRIKDEKKCAHFSSFFFFFFCFPPLTIFKTLLRLTQVPIKWVTKITFSGIFPGWMEESLNNRANFVGCCSTKNITK